MKFSQSWLISMLSMAVLSLTAETLSEKGYVREWLISGPYPSYQKNGKGSALDTDFLNGEAQIIPYPGLKNTATFIADKSKLIASVGSSNEWGVIETKTYDTTWQSRTFDKDIISFSDNAFPVQDYFAIYAVTFIESPKDQKAVFHVGSDDDHKLYLNGALIGRQSSSQDAKPHFKYNVNLRSGVNVAVMKIVDRTHDFGYALGIFDSKMIPLSGIKIYSDHPGRKFNAELFSNDCGGTFLFDSKDLMAGKQKVKIQLYNPKRYQVLFNGKELVSDSLELNLTEETRRLTLTFLDGEKKVAEVSKTIRVYSPEKLDRENASLEKRIHAMKEESDRLETRSKQLSANLDRARKELASAYDDREKRYESERAVNLRGAKKSVSEALPKVSPRTVLCLNGEWEFSCDRTNWKKTLLPNWMMIDFFVNWYFPAKKVNPKDVHGACIAEDPFKEYFTVDDSITGKHVFFRTNFQSDGKDVFILQAESIIGKFKVFCNGVFCGEYLWKYGISDIELKSVKKGVNTLEIEYTRLDNESGGLRGDINLVQAPRIRVRDIYVKPSWRKGTLETRTEIFNGSDAETTVEILQYAVTGNIIRHKLPEKKIVLKPGKTTELRNLSRWENPQLWGIGGKYGDPDLYDLVTDLRIDGKTFDRHVQSFGFREFWIFQTDFYLNGKRIILQGEVGSDGWPKRRREIFWDILRRDGINLFRTHDSFGQWSNELAVDADRMGMLIYAQMYPILHENDRKGNSKKFSSAAAWLATPEHQQNLLNYERWFRMFRNHPSVVIWSSDNEIVTQAIDDAGRADYNVRNDRIAAMYEKYMETLDPDLVLTRDGDIGTWNSLQRWYEEPPCDTANYHYPDFNIADWVVNWQSVFEYRPAIYGETLYHSYGAWDKWIGAIPMQVAMKAQTVRRVASLYRRLGVPAAIYMGLGSDGYVQYDDTGKGNPFGITKSMNLAFREKKILPPGMKPDQFPNYRIEWPALSGKGYKSVATRINVTGTHGGCCNWFDSRYPTHVRNAVNDAYRDSLIPQPPLRAGSDAECVVKTTPNTDVCTTLPSGEKYALRTDRDGKAWFQLALPGTYTFTANGKSASKTLPARGNAVLKPGFGKILQVELK